MEEVPIAVDEAIVFEVAAAEATAAAELADNITAATKFASGTADAPEEGVNAAKMAIKGAVEAPEGAVSAGIVDDVGLTQGGSSRSSDRVDSALLDSTPPSKFYVRRSRRVNVDTGGKILSNPFILFRFFLDTDCHNPIFTHRIFSDVGTQNGTARAEPS